jgi:hypothetical protein
MLRINNIKANEFGNRRSLYWFLNVVKILLSLLLLLLSLF